ncbi:MAG: hypothetical protein HYS52_00190 [Candidatus Wildermuthbacteria bacterium]|nr:hypothetical protein [Candidatus Wildermuthbacteria bacterium]
MLQYAEGRWTSLGDTSRGTPPVTTLAVAGVERRILEVLAPSLGLELVPQSETPGWVEIGISNLGTAIAVAEIISAGDTAVFVFPSAQEEVLLGLLKKNPVRARPGTTVTREEVTIVR